MTPLPPGSCIGILGGGQLARMLALAAARLGFKSHIFSPPGDPCAASVAHRLTQAPYDDHDALRHFSQSVDVLTYEFENIPVSALVPLLEAGKVILPNPLALSRTQDRFLEKTYLRSLGLQTPDFWKVSSLLDLQKALDASCHHEQESSGDSLGIEDGRSPLNAMHSHSFSGNQGGLLKTRRMGYDGKGQERVSRESDLLEVWKRFEGKECVFESFIPFSFEISVISVRGQDGRFLAYPPPINTHCDGILRRCDIVEGALDPLLVQNAKEMNRLIMEDLDYVGVMAVEYFVLEGASSPLLINEIAPRVHNSGHWTEALCATSQFEQHIRAIAGWPLGDVTCHHEGIMENLLGEEAKKWREWAEKEGTVLHLYDKTPFLEGRKMGHVTRLLAPISSSKSHQNDDVALSPSQKRDEKT